MEQNRPAPRRALSPKERRRRHRIRLVRNWTVFLLSCGAVMAVMTGGILWLLPRAYALIAPPTTFEAREYEGGAETDLSDKRLVLVNANLPLTEEPTPELAVADDATGVSLEAEAAAAYREMAEAAKQDEVELVLTAGYQDTAARQSAYEAAVQSYRESGCSEEEAAARAATVQPAPEASERLKHHAGSSLTLLRPANMPPATVPTSSRQTAWRRTPVSPTPVPMSGWKPMPQSTASSCAGRRSVRLLPAWCLSRGTGGMWAGTTPSPSAPPASRWKSIWRWNKRNNTKGR